MPALVVAQSFQEKRRRMAADGTDILSTFACLVFLPILVALVSTVIMGQLPSIDLRKDW